ncbi:MAG: squalene synthase HpnC [Planctomycetia bacterium]|nr:squalene synthase HpnC [Planctomycetia bacterium]
MIFPFFDISKKPISAALNAEIISTGFPIKDLARFGPEQNMKLSPVQANIYCRSLAKKHYENFSVATFLLPPEMRNHFYAVYAFCRWADDLADETPESDSLLTWWEELLSNFYDTLEKQDETVTHPVFMALKFTVREFQIPKNLFSDLLIAFRQDQRVHEYFTREQLLDYCRYSANPVGRIILHLARITDEESLKMSDSICTGLQLANFWQDVARDWREKSRIYIPAEDRERFGVSSAAFLTQKSSPEFLDLMREEVAWAETFFRAGAALPDRLPRIFSRDVKLFSAGGQAILQAIKRQKYDVWKCRPRVSKFTKFLLLLKYYF